MLGKCLYPKCMMKQFINIIYIVLLSQSLQALAEEKGLAHVSREKIVQQTVALFNVAPHGDKLLDKLQAFLTSKEITGLENIPGLTKGAQSITITASGEEVLIRDSKSKQLIHLKVIDQDKGEFTLNGVSWTFQPWLSPTENAASIAKLLHAATTVGSVSVIERVLSFSLLENSAQAIFGVDDGVIFAVYLAGAGITFWGCGVQWLLDQANMPITSPDFDLSKVPGSCVGAAVAWPVLVGAAVYKNLIEPGMNTLGSRFQSPGPVAKMDGLRCVFQTNHQSQRQELLSVTAHFSNGFETKLLNSADGTHTAKMFYPNGLNAKTQRQNLALGSQVKFDKNWISPNAGSANVASLKLLATSCENPLLRQQFGDLPASNPASPKMLDTRSRGKPSAASGQSGVGTSESSKDAK